MSSTQISGQPHESTHLFLEECSICRYLSIHWETLSILLLKLYHLMEKCKNNAKHCPQVYD